MIQNSGRVIYDDRAIPLCGLDDTFSDYLNRLHFQRALGLEEWNFASLNWDLNERWGLSREVYVPTTREMTWILDQTSIGVSVINGNNDIIM